MKIDGSSGSRPISRRGDEPFEDLAASETVHPAPGEVVFVDDDGTVHARRWCWRQSAAGAAGPETTDAIVVTEGLHDRAADDVESALGDLTDLLAEHRPQTLSAWTLSPAITQD